MKKALRLLFLLFIVLFALISCDENQQMIINPTTPSPTIRGTVSIPQGADLSGSDFYIRVMEGEKAVYTGRVNADGSFSVPGLSEEATYSILLTTEEPGDIKGTERDISRATTTSGYGGWLSNVTASINEQAGVGSIKVKPLGTIKGVVKKDGAEDNYDTTVYIPGTSYLAMTDGEGNFSLFNVPQATYTLRYISNGYMAKMVDNVVLYSESDTENPVTTVQQQTLIKNAGNFIGTISKTGSMDHSNITVMLSDGENTFTGSTGADGSLLISNIIPGIYSATISSSGFLTQTVEGIVIEAAKSTTILPVNLVANGGSIVGAVSLNNNGDKAGAIITAKGVDSDYSYTASTDVEGKFVITNAFSGNYTITISKTNYTSVTIENVSSVAGQTTQIGTTNLSSMYGSVSGKVALADSADNSGVTVTQTFIADPTIAPATVSGADGTYAFNNLTNAGQYSLTFSKDGYISSTGTVVTVTLGQNTIVEDITLRSLASKVSGKVTLEGTEDYTGISVLLRSGDDSIQYDATTDRQGSYVMARVNPGEYTLTVSKAGYVSKTVSDFIVESSTEKTLDDVSLNIGTRSISGNVTLELRSDYSGALIAATNLSDPTVVYSAISNTEGNYTLAGMKPGEYVISVSCAGYNTATLPTINITEGNETTLDSFELKIARGTISGTATLEGRGINAGVTVELLKGTDIYATTTTDDSGAYAFNVPQGNYSGVRLTCENFKSVSIAQDIALIANDYVTIGQNAAMIATHVPVVRGRLTVKNLLSLDYSGIQVTIQENGMTTTTDHDGYWSFEKVPVGHYTLKFERENTNPVTMAVDIVASAEKNIETIELIPNAASIEGHVTLYGLTDHSGVTVRATAEGMAELTTKTNAAGYFYIGNVVTTETYTVHFEKDGWVSQTKQISGLEDLSVNDITEADPITLMDTTAPVLNSVSITVGNSELEGRKLNVYINATEEGSGISKVYVNTINDFEGIEPINYATPLICYVPDAEGSYTLYVKVEDKSGNHSTVSSQAFSIADYKTVVSSVVLDNEDGVNDGIVTWTKAKSPYYVTGNILVDENTTLIIEPGVNVQFSGVYNIQVEGRININGTKDEKVYLYGVGVGENNWKGINVVNDNGSTIRYASITGMEEGPKGYICITDSLLSASASGSALGYYSNDGYSGNFYFKGSISRSTIIGKIATENAILSINDMSIPAGYLYESILGGNTLDGSSLMIAVTSIDNCTFKTITLQLESVSGINSEFSDCILNVSNGLLYRCNLERCMFSSFYCGAIRDSNIIDCGKLSTTTRRSECEMIDLTGNYWGVNNTAELNSNGINSNLSFIGDYYDDFNVTKADLSGYRMTAIEDAGTVEIAETPAQYSIGDNGPAGGIIFYDKGYYSDGWRYLEAAPSDIAFDDNYVTVFGYFRTSDNGTNQRTETGYGVGFGKLNTQLLVSDMGDEAYRSFSGTEKTGDYAARVCDIYSYGGYDDWFLPSRDELNLMYVNLHKKGIGAFASKGYEYGYWSSSEHGNYSDNAYYACLQYFSDGFQFGYNREGNYRVRCARAF